MGLYYATPSPGMPGRFDLRQERFRAQRAAGKEHPHDVCAVCFKPDELRDVCEKFGFNADLSALNETETKGEA